MFSPLNVVSSQCPPSQCLPFSMSSLFNVFYSQCLPFSMSSLFNVFYSQYFPFCPSQHQSPDPILLSLGRELQCRSCPGQYQRLNPNPFCLEWERQCRSFPDRSPTPIPFFLGGSIKANPAPVVLTPTEEAWEVLCGAIDKMCRNEPARPICVWDLLFPSQPIP